MAELLEEGPLELKGRPRHGDSLARFEDGLERMTKVAKVENFESMARASRGWKRRSDAGAGQVEKMAKYTLPKVSFKGC